MKILRDILSKPFVILAIATCFMIFGSAKWTLFFAPWIGHAALLYYVRHVTFWKSICWGSASLFIATLIGGYEVVPAPMPIFPVIALVIGVKSILPYFVDRATRANEKGFYGTLIFPSACVTLEYLDSFGGSGTWGSIAHTQYQIQPLLQVASITGIWGVSFLVYWFASITAWMLGEQFSWPIIRNGSFISIGVYLSVLAFGVIRIAGSESTNVDRVKIAGITLDNSNMMEMSYYEAFSKNIELPEDLAQTSPEAEEAFRSLPPFIEDPYNEKFRGTRQVMAENLDELFERSLEQIRNGAKIVVWSEAIGLILENDEPEIIDRAQKFANDNNAYLIMGLGVIVPGPMDGIRLFMVNKTITLSPEGELLNIYLKSNPVPFGEQDYGSDDIIPVLPTDYGNLSPVICYDADFNHFMKQAGQNSTDILFVPSGDWKAIAPYHSYMASLRYRKWVFCC